MKAVLILAALLVATAQRSAGQRLQSWRGCYSLTWSDSSNGRDLPTRVRLDAQRDTLMHHPPFPPMYVVSGPSTGSESGAPFVRLSQTWWWPVGRDSVHFTVVDVLNVQWDVNLGEDGDSLVGEAQGMDGDAAYGPLSLTLRRRSCR